MSTEDEILLRITRELVGKTRFTPQKSAIDPKLLADVKAAKSLAACRSKRLQQTCSTISDKANTEIYSIEKERQSMTHLMLDEVMKTVSKQVALKSSLKKVAGVLRQSLQVSLIILN